MNEIYINIKSNNYLTHMQCGLCGGDFHTGLAVAELEEMSNPPSVLWGICPTCLSEGPKIAALRTKEHAKGLREWADQLDKLAAGMNIMPDNHWKTANDLKAEDDRLENLLRLREDEHNRKIGEMIADADEIANSDVPF